MDMQELIESLSPIEKKVTPFLSLQSFDEIIEKSGLDRVSVLRALEFLNSKKVIELKIEKKKIIDLGTNGIYYKKKGLPERQLLLIAEQGPVSLQNAQKQSRLSDNEFKAAIGALKKKALADIKNGRLIFTGDKSDIVKKSLEEQFIDLLPLEFDNISAEQKFSLDKLKDRKDIVIITEEQVVSFTLTKLGKDLVKEDLSKIDLIEELTSEMIQKESWKGKKFRRYDVESQVPKINGGKEHFVNQTIDYGRRVWTEMGFKEMKGSLIQESFWNFDALFTAQDHPVRDLQDTFFINSLGDLGKYGKVVDSVKKSHEQGVDGNKGWGGKWNTKEAEKLVLCLINGNREEFNLEGSVRIEGDINQITQTRLVLGILADYSDRNNYDLYLLSERSGDSAVFKRKAFKELITGPDIIKRFDEEINYLEDKILFKRMSLEGKLVFNENAIVFHEYTEWTFKKIINLAYKRVFLG